MSADSIHPPAGSVAAQEEIDAVKAQNASLSQAVLKREHVILRREQSIREYEQAIRQIERVFGHHPTWLARAPGVVFGESPVAAQIDVVMPALQGWCTPRKAYWMAELIQSAPSGRPIVEVGVFGGKSLLPIAIAAKACGVPAVYGVEPWSNQIAVETPTTEINDTYWSTLDFPAIKKNFLAVLIAAGLQDIVKILEVPAADANRLLSGERFAPFSLIHIDGSHSEAQAFADVTAWEPLLAPGGVLVMDDILWPSVAKARAWLRNSMVTMAEVIENGAEGQQIGYGAYRRR